MESAYGVQLFLNEVLDSNYIAGEFVDGYDTDNALFIKIQFLVLLITNQ